MEYICKRCKTAAIAKSLNEIIEKQKLCEVCLESKSKTLSRTYSSKKKRKLFQCTSCKKIVRHNQRPIWCECGSHEFRKTKNYK